MKKFVCTVCGYVHEGDAAPAKCPICGDSGYNGDDNDDNHDDGDDGD